MNNYINTQTGEYPISRAFIRSSYPHVSFPEFFENYEMFDIVHNSSYPEQIEGFRIIEAQPIIVDGRWIKQFKHEEIAKVVSSSFNDLRDAAINVRRNRLIMLKDSDWTQGKDIPDEVSLRWQPYRQALRDITTQPGFPYDIIWPEPPTSEPNNDPSN